MCEVIRAEDGMLFTQYFLDSAHDVLSKGLYEKMNRHLHECYPCKENYEDFLSIFPQPTKSRIEQDRIRKTVKRLYLEIRSETEKPYTK